MRPLHSLLPLTLLLLSAPLLAQLPEQPEDVSPLLVGETVPNLPVGNVDEEIVMLHDLLLEKPTVLVFYRGGWCPYCNRHLAELGQREAAILEQGYQIIAVSPDAAESLQATGEKVELNYTLLSDADGTLSRGVGIAFQAPERYSERLAEVSAGKNKGFLPVPAVFVLDTEGTILFEYINPNYQQRLSGAVLMAVLENL